jgi:hypothetical protein
MNMTWFRQEKPGGNHDGKMKESGMGVWLAASSLFNSLLKVSQ